MVQTLTHERVEIKGVLFVQNSISEEGTFLTKSLLRFSKFLKNFTDIKEIENINESHLYQYLMFHKENDFDENTFFQVLKDIKNVHFYLKHICGMKNPPKMDLSIQNHEFWLSL